MRIVCSLLILLFFITSCSEQAKAPSTSQGSNTSPPSAIATATNRPFQFPRDEGVHPNQPIEWWYLNSQFSDATGKQYAFVLCKFSTGRHLVSLFDKTANATWVKDYYEAVNGRTDRLDLSSITGTWKQSGAPFNYDVDFHFEGVTFNVALKAKKKPFFPGGDGLIEMGEKGTSYYYAVTDLGLIGTMKAGTNAVQTQISGTAWVDHQWGNWDWVNDFSQWKWYSVKLDNGVDLMLFNIYKNKKLIQSHCGYIEANNQQFHKLRCGFATQKYYTDVSGGKWQQQVDLELPDLPNTKLTLISESDQQFIQPMVLWEGSMKAKGLFKGAAVHGTAYGELNRPD